MKLSVENNPKELSHYFKEILACKNIILNTVLFFLTLFGIYSIIRKVIAINLCSDAAFWGLLNYEMWSNLNFNFSTYFYVDSAFGIFPNRLLEIPLHLMLKSNPMELTISWALLIVSYVLIFSYIMYLVTKDITKVLLFSALSSNINLSSYYDFGMVSHAGTILICGIFIIIVMKFFFYNKRVNSITISHITSLCFLFLILLSVFSNLLIIVIFIIPITISYFFFYDNKNSKLNILFISIPILSYLCYKYNTAIAQAIIPNPPVFHQYMRSMASVDIIDDNAVLLLKGIVWLLNENLKRILDAPDFFSIIILLLLLLIGAYSIYYFSKEENPRAIFLNRYLLTSILVLSTVYVMSGMAVNIMTTRYLIFIPIAIFMLISLSYNSRNHIFTLLILLFLAINVTGNFFHLQSIDTDTNRNQYELIDFLQEHDLYYGYGEYWDSNIITFLSRFKVTICPVLISNSKILPMNWLCNANWYNYPPDADVFVLLKMDTIPNGHIQTDLTNLVAINPPKKILQFQEYTIYIWNGTSFKIPQYIGEMYTLGTKIIFGKDGTSDKFLMTGWSYPEDGSTWTEGYKSVLGIPTTKTDSDLNLTITAIQFTTQQRVYVTVNDYQIGEWCFNGSNVQEKSIIIPHETLNDRVQYITFDLPDAKSPKNLGLSEDGRTLALAVRSIVVTSTIESEKSM